MLSSCAHDICENISQVDFGPATEANEWDDSDEDNNKVELAGGNEDQASSSESSSEPQAEAVARSFPPATISPAVSPPKAPTGLAVCRDDPHEDSYSYGDAPSEEISIPDEMSPVRFDHDVESAEWH